MNISHLQIRIPLITVRQATRFTRLMIIIPNAHQARQHSRLAKNRSRHQVILPSVQMTSLQHRALGFNIHLLLNNEHRPLRPISKLLRHLRRIIRRLSRPNLILDQRIPNSMFLPRHLTSRAFRRISTPLPTQPRLQSTTRRLTMRLRQNLRHLLKRRTNRQTRRPPPRVELPILGIRFHRNNNRNLHMIKLNSIRNLSPTNRTSHLRMHQPIMTQDRIKRLIRLMLIMNLR